MVKKISKLRKGLVSKNKKIWGTKSKTASQDKWIGMRALVKASRDIAKNLQWHLSILFIGLLAQAHKRKK